MDVLSSKPISAAQAATLLKKFVDAKQEEVNADLMMNDEVKFQLVQVLENLEGKKPQPVAEADDSDDDEEEEGDDE